MLLAFSTFDSLAELKKHMACPFKIFHLQIYLRAYSSPQLARVDDESDEGFVFFDHGPEHPVLGAD